MLALYRKEIAFLVALAPLLLAKHSPGQALRLWCDRLVKYGVVDIVHAATSAQDRQEHYGPMLGAVRQIIKACESSGDLPAGTDPEDVLVLIELLWRIPPSRAGEERVRRLLALAFRGLGSKDSSVHQ